MGTKAVKFSDLSGQITEDEGELGRLVVREHPDYAEPITLDVLPDDLGDLSEERAQFVSLEYFAPGETLGHRLVVRREDFNGLAKNKAMDTILETALVSQRQERRAEALEPRRRGRPRRTGTGVGERIDYTRPEYAGMPHRGRTTEAEREYVREHLDEVNARLRAAGLREIDPNDQRMQERYGLTPQATAAS
jgi:hypothetical protein